MLARRAGRLAAQSYNDFSLAQRAMRGYLLFGEVVHEEVVALGVVARSHHEQTPRNGDNRDTY